MIKANRQGVRRGSSFWLSAMFVLMLCGRAEAVEVRASVSAREVYLGESFTYSIEIKNGAIREEDIPELPRIAGVQSSGPSRSDQTTIMNGKVTKTVVLSYRLFAQREGVLTIPALTVVAGGKSFRTSGQRLNVVRALTAGDLLFVEVSTNHDEIFLGEPIEATLRIWVKPYRDKQFKQRLDEGNMWSCIEAEKCVWGLFAQRKLEMDRARRRPSGREVLRDNGSGNESSYFLYEMKATLWPKSAGPLNLSSISVHIDYPERLRRRNDFFRNRLEIGKTRPLSVRADAVNKVLIKSLPEEGRPPWFTGAVGRFDMQVHATPTDAAVGDPITLAITVKDVTRTATQLELLSAPALNRVDDLTRDFRLPNDPLAGVVDGRIKRFNQTIRALNEDVRQIPSLPFAYFSPSLKAYKTVWSKPIPLTVRPVSTLAMSDVVGVTDNSASAPTSLTSLSGGLLANYSDPAELLQSSRGGVSWWIFVVIGIPPMVYIGSVIGHRRRLRLRDDRGYARRRRAGKDAARRLAEAKAVQESDRPEAFGAAVSGYIADRCDLPAGMTSVEVVERLHEVNVNDELIAQLQTFLQECEQSRYAGMTSDNGSNLADRADRLIQQLSRERLS